MALIAGQIPVSGYQTPDYSRAAEAAGAAGAAPYQAISNLAGQATDMYGQMKQFKGKQEAFGKSMDYMAKAFPERAEMFTGAKSAVFNPNANMIQQAAAMSEYQNQFDMINKMQTQMDMMRQRQQSQQGGGDSVDSRASDVR